MRTVGAAASDYPDLKFMLGKDVNEKRGSNKLQETSVVISYEPNVAASTNLWKDAKEKLEKVVEVL